MRGFSNRFAGAARIGDGRIIYGYTQFVIAGRHVRNHKVARLVEISEVASVRPFAPTLRNVDQLDAHRLVRGPINSGAFLTAGYQLASNRPPGAADGYIHRLIRLNFDRLLPARRVLRASYELGHHDAANRTRARYHPIQNKLAHLVGLPRVTVREDKIKVTHAA